MSYQLIVKPEAERDLLETAFWYQKQSPGLEEVFLASAEEKFKIIENNPYLFAIHYQQLRQAILNRFPFAIHYTIEEENIYVLAMAHTSRHPRSWQERER